jgi:Leucine-rich repeat (LRR) protein
VVHGGGVVDTGELSNLSGVAHFSRLESLVADQNRLPDTESIPALPNLHTLSLNKNKITDILKFAADVGVKLPALAHVSLLGNPCCPSEIFGGTPEQ